MQTETKLRAAYAEALDEGERLAGRLENVAQRAAIYHHLYDHSGGNHIFPLIAAHGALWARGYFREGLRWGELLAWQFWYSAARRAEKLAELHQFADAFREINRRVCADTYATYHFVDRYGDDSAAAHIVSPALLAATRELHVARREGRELSDARKREIFSIHFLNEQRTVVAPRIAAAMEKLNWPLVKWLSLRPTIRFAYLPATRPLKFRRFDSTDERIAHGLAAFDAAQQVGWRNVERALEAYDILPSTFFADPAAFVAQVKLEV